MVTKKCIILKTSGRISEKNLNENIDINNVVLGDVNTLFVKKGTGKFERHCDYDMSEYVISIFGWKQGKSGNENKTELPPPEDTDLYFGDIMVIKSMSINPDDYNNRSIVDLNKKMYNDFIEKAFGGFESLGDEDTEEEIGEDKYDSDDSFIVNSDEIINEDDISSEEEYISNGTSSDEGNESFSLHSDTSDDETSSNSQKDSNNDKDSSSELPESNLHKTNSSNSNSNSSSEDLHESNSNNDSSSDVENVILSLLRNVLFDLCTDGQ